jgi:hypothetical protein
VKRGLVLALLLAVLRAPTLGAQIVVGLGPLLPIGDLNARLDARPGWTASARLGVGLPLASFQFEWSYARFRFADAQDAGLRSVSRFAVGTNLVVQVPVGLVRPYAVIGGSVGSRRVTEMTFQETSWRAGYHLGGGVDLSVGPVKPYLEVRYTSVDAPGNIRDTYIPVIVGFKVF